MKSSTLANLSTWMRSYIIDLCTDVPQEQLWERFEHINAPGWTLMHLVVEGEMALQKLDVNYTPILLVQDDFESCSSGNATSTITLPQMLDHFTSVYHQLATATLAQEDHLANTPISDEELKYVLRTELDFYTHMLTTHLAMHTDALMKWRLKVGLGSPY